LEENVMRGLRNGLMAAAVLVVGFVGGAARGEMSFLRAEGVNIVDAEGKVVDLRGINLGGWLVQEMWMMPFETRGPGGGGGAVAATQAGGGTRPRRRPEIPDQVTLWKTIEGRLGAAAMGRVRTAMRNAWLNESDFDRIQKAGFNLVRLPFRAAMLEEPGGMEWLDRAVAWGEKRGIYVVLDLHGAPGGQAADQPTGDVSHNEFFKDHANVEKACALWTTLATRYKDRAAVAGYDLVNEPMGAPNAETVQVVNDAMYRAIRAVDAKHLVFAEDGYKGTDSFPVPAAAGWSNVVYSTHHYDFQAKSVEDQLTQADDLFKRVTKLQSDFGVPVYVGEFNQAQHGTAETMHALAVGMTARHWAWSVWTYKIIFRQGNDSMWGLYTNEKELTRINPFSDTEAEMVAKMPQYRTENLQENPAIVRMMEPGR
jgi:endoglucanase